MENSDEDNELLFPPNPQNDDDDEEGNDDDEEDDVVSHYQNHRNPQPSLSQLRKQHFKLETLTQRLLSELDPIRVHNVLINGNTKTKDWIIEAELNAIHNATTVQDLLRALEIALSRLQSLEVFESSKVRLEPGPPELPNTTNVVIDVVETVSKVSGEFGVFTKLGTSSWTAEGTLKYKNLLGYGDLWDASAAYGANQATELSVGVYAPRLKGSLTPLVARLSILSQDWQEFSSYKEQLLGMSLGLISTKHHDLAYTLGWRTLTDPSQMSSRSIRRQLGHGLLSSLKYTYKVDRRNSPIRPTKGHAFLSTTHFGGLTPDHRSLRFLRQEFDVRYAVPFGFYNTALNFGISAGAVFPWGRGFMDKPSPLPERFYLGGDFSPVCTLGGPMKSWGFKTRELGPTEPQRKGRDGIFDGYDDSSRWDSIGGDLAVTAFADLSFDIPIRWLREYGIHGHVFAGAGNTTKLTQNEHKNFSPRKFLDSCQTSVGCGFVIPTRLFRLEGNYYYILKQNGHDHGKTGFRFGFSAPS
ncbi:PREDICTED: sorting and assembly machinery component 50 homolog isoform X2 [Lupinus angustifolius]|uniref:sorting and assembly machinery component 50 homolog isoform X2 n=1 Tax=Lupinus angustifolius TaxID=3871 RepID=UPI00092EB7DC|nr:PREDICTED: sorting and assembly machinery component 50 homolog isoform X2 [Lupinus angustifolius]